MFPPLNAPTDAFPYRIDRQVGIGSMGVVYRAVEVPLDRPVAIKALRQSVLAEEPPDAQEEMRQRFLQEARAAAALSHPGVTTVYRVGKEDGLPYMVMEWLDGRSLEELLEQRPRLEIAHSVRLVVSLLETLDAAHRQGVVHRDIKPSNLMLLADGRLKVTDFGIALLKGRELVKTQAGVVLATPKFASPEQLRGLEVDGRADLFATGILLYRLLTGSFPFEGATFLELTTAILQEEPVPARERHGEIPPALEAVLRRALRKNRKDRFASAAEMADELRPFLSGDVPELLISPERAGRSRAGSPDVYGEVLAGGETVYRELPPATELALLRVVTSWPSRGSSHRSTAGLLDRLLDEPLHAPAFTGAATIGDACLLISEGVLVGAFDLAAGTRGDAVVEALPVAAAPVLYRLPEGLVPRTVSLLASLLRPLESLQADLDTSLINLPAFAEKLRQEAFDGALRLRFGDALGALLFAGGKAALGLFSEGWRDVPVESSWRGWLARFPIRARLEPLRVEPLNEWYRRRLRGFEFEVTPAASGAPDLRPAAPAAADPEQAPASRCLRFLLEDLPQELAERDRVPRWKYLGEWIPLVQKACLYCDLTRADSRLADAFDFMTSDENGKVLHVGQRVAQLSALDLRDFVERVVAAKKARRKTGDIGGALLVTPELGAGVVDAYEEVLAESSKTWFGVEESFTGYSGFVRIGARRGFHLLLVEETDQDFVPLI